MRCKACTRHEARERGCDAHHTSPMNFFRRIRRVPHAGAHCMAWATAEAGKFSWNGRRGERDLILSLVIWLFGCFGKH